MTKNFLHSFLKIILIFLHEVLLNFLNTSSNCYSKFYNSSWFFQNISRNFRNNFRHFSKYYPKFSKILCEIFLESISGNFWKYFSKMSEQLTVILDNGGYTLANQTVCIWFVYGSLIQLLCCVHKAHAWWTTVQQTLSLCIRAKKLTNFGSWRTYVNGLVCKYVPALTYHSVYLLWCTLMHVLFTLPSQHTGVLHRKNERELFWVKLTAVLNEFVRCVEVNLWKEWKWFFNTRSGFLFSNIISERSRMSVCERLSKNTSTL